jgi:hypothetical protein
MLKAVKNEANLRYRRFRKAIDKRLIGQLFPDRKIKKANEIRALSWIWPQRSVDRRQLLDPRKSTRHGVRMGHQQQRHGLLLALLSYQLNNPILIGRVDIGRRLIGQKQDRTIHQRSGHRDSLLQPDR